MQCNDLYVSDLPLPTNMQVIFTTKIIAASPSTLPIWCHSSPIRNLIKEIRKMQPHVKKKTAINVGALVFEITHERHFITFMNNIFSSRSSNHCASGTDDHTCRYHRLPCDCAKQNHTPCQLRRAAWWSKQQRKPAAIKCISCTDFFAASFFATIRSHSSGE